ncbi:MAG: hypothetical protein J07HX5_00275 [halophilic archaeon J07HX5]|jgi:hypothetical protein|nr:MAG: hypothetical protein J07HX5_00275 [halophilic archaeon J07HX5]
MSQTVLSSDHQLARLLQIGVVLEEVAEARAERYAAEPGVAPELAAYLRDAAQESATHRMRLNALTDQLNADTVPYEQIETLVGQRYEADTAFDGILYDQLCSEETAYKFYDDLIAALAGTDTRFTVDRRQIVTTLRSIRADEQAGVEKIARLMETME